MHRKISFCLLSILIMFSLANAQMKKVAQSKMQFLKLGVGARAVAMGDAFMAISGDPISIFYNPAGCAYTEGLSLAFTQTNWIADIDHKAGVLTYNTGRYGVIIADYITVDYGSMERTVVDAHAWEGYISQGNFSAGEYAFGLGYATAITDRFSLGGQVKYAYQDLASSQVWQYLYTEFQSTKRIKNETEAVAYDFGTFYNSDFKNIRIGMSVQNFANKPLPITFRFGAAIDLNELIAPNEKKYVLTFAVDALHPKDYSERMHFGLEYVFDNLFALRGGYKLNYDEESFTGGFGLKTAIKGLHMQFDYSFTNFGAFGFINRFSLGIRL
ncbi:MAG: UPF0164 family protein [Calditrichaeota bacterium]|nr:UPF0164 family protein [Calditrichota bacterium]